MPPGIEVREAHKGDAETVYDLACELASVVGDSEPGREAVEERFAELLETPLARNLVAEEEGEVVGLISFWVKPDLAHGDTVIEIPMLAVLEGARRRGVGKLLIEQAQDVAYEKGVNLIELIATPDNTTAREFYRSLGFLETDHIALEFHGDLEDPPEADEK